jgi:CheY-like chemotaxis protein
MSAPLGLIVDDDPQVRELFTQVLLRGGIRTIEARSGLEALGLAQDVTPDFVVTDLDMPDMGGFELCRRLRQLTTTTMVPIVVVTGDHSQSDDAAAAGCDVVLAKPCPPALLLATILRLLGKDVDPPDAN